MTPLPLAGTADQVKGSVHERRRVLRLRSAKPIDTPVTSADAAIVRNEVDLALARKHKFRSLVLLDYINKVEDCDLIAQLDRRFGYLSDGDVVALDTGSRRFRVLYRKKSSHNSFLVTERCDNYCLMCSQPPKK